MTEAPSRRDRQRQSTRDEIVAVSRELLVEPSGISLRSIAQRMGITAPALYRYVASHQDLMNLLAIEIDRAATHDYLEPAVSSQAADDPAAQITCAAIAFRTWALAHKEEFGVVFANTDADPVCADGSLQADSASGALFTALLTAIWQKYQFALPSLEELEPALVEVLHDPVMPGDHDSLPDEYRGLIWIFMRSWAALYGTVTLEVFGHLDPRIIESGVLFQQMFEDQARLLGLADELPRLRRLIAEQMT